MQYVRLFNTLSCECEKTWDTFSYLNVVNIFTYSAKENVIFLTSKSIKMQTESDCILLCEAF